MKFILIFNIAHSENMPYEKVYDVLGKEFGLHRFEKQDDRKVLTPTTTVLGENDKYKSAEKLCEAVRDRLYQDEIIFDRMLVARADDYLLLG